MKSNKSVFTLVLLAVAVLVMSAAAAAPALTYTYKNVTIKGALEVDTYGLNNKGEISGDYVDSAAAQHGMILNGKKLTSFDDKNCSSTAGSTGIAMYGVNSAGTAVGFCTLTSSGEYVGVMYSKGKVTEISYPNALETQANGINDKGAIVGDFIDTAGAEHGFLLSGKKYTQIDAPSPDTSSVAWSINNKGQITVYAVDSAGGYEGFILTGKKFTKVDDPNEGSLGTVAHKINNKGDVDGTYYDTASVTHGFLLHGGKYYTLDDPAGADTRADGLNDSLVIVGRWGSGSYGGTGFEATPKK